MLGSGQPRFHLATLYFFASLELGYGSSRASSVLCGLWKVRTPYIVRRISEFFEGNSEVLVSVVAAVKYPKLKRIFADKTGDCIRSVADTQDGEFRHVAKD